MGKKARGAAWPLLLSHFPAQNPAKVANFSWEKPGDLKVKAGEDGVWAREILQWVITPYNPPSKVAISSEGTVIISGDLQDLPRGWQHCFCQHREYTVFYDDHISWASSIVISLFSPRLYSVSWAFHSSLYTCAISPLPRTWGHILYWYSMYIMYMFHWINTTVIHSFPRQGACWTCKKH